MKAANLTGPDTIKLEDRPLPEPGPTEVRLRPLAVGICGSDLHAYRGKHPFINPPMVLGHEVGGRIDKLGVEVKDHTLGELVTVDPCVVLEEDFNTRIGRYQIADKRHVIGCLGPDGGMAEYMIVPAALAVPVPQDWTPEQAAFVEPAAVGVHAVKQGALKKGMDVVVIGAGTIGLVTAQAAKALGADKVMVVDQVVERLELAKNLGADIIVDTSKEDLGEQIQAAYGSKRADVIFDCVTINATINTAIEVARRGTRIVVVGIPEERVATDLALVQDKELELVGTLMYVRSDYEDAIEMIRNGSIKVEPIVTHHYSLEQVNEAFDTALNNKTQALKIMLHPNGAG